MDTTVNRGQIKTDNLEPGMQYAPSSPTNDPNEKALPMVILWFNDDYLKSIPGIIRVLQVVLSLIGLICVTSSGTEETSYLSLPLAWHIRLYVFVSVFGFLLSLLVATANCTGLKNMLPIDWVMFDLLLYSMLSFLYLVCSSLVASAVSYFRSLPDQEVTSWTIEQLIVGVVLGYICMVLFAITAYLAYRQRHPEGLSAFNPRRFSTYSSSSSQRNKDLAMSMDMQPVV